MATTPIIEMYEGKPMLTVEKGLVTGKLPAVTVTCKDPHLHWNGSKIPNTLLRKTVAFSRWVYRKYGGEVQWRLAHNETTDQWAVLVLKQYISRGMESEECGDDGDIGEALAKLPKGGKWKINGTGHSHCNSDAFKSSTDHKDEHNQTGFHYTVGHVEDDEFDLHARYSFRGVMYTYKDAKHMFARGICLSTKRLPKFPKEWTQMLIEKPVPKKVEFTSHLGANIQVYRGAHPYPFGEHGEFGMWNGYGYGNEQRLMLTKEDYEIVRDTLKEMFPDHSMRNVIEEISYCERKRERNIEDQKRMANIRKQCGSQKTSDFPELFPTDDDGYVQCQLCTNAVQHEGEVCEECIALYANM